MSKVQDAFDSLEGMVAALKRRVAAKPALNEDMRAAYNGKIEGIETAISIVKKSIAGDKTGLFTMSDNKKKIKVRTGQRRPKYEQEYLDADMEGHASQPQK